MNLNQVQNILATNAIEKSIVNPRNLFLGLTKLRMIPARRVDRKEMAGSRQFK